MAHLCWNPDGELRRNKPEALRGCDLHHARGCVDELIGTVRMLRHLPGRRILIREACNRNARTGIVGGFYCLSHKQHYMTHRASCDRELSMALYANDKRTSRHGQDDELHHHT